MPIDLLKDQRGLRQLGEIRIGYRIPLEGVDRNGKPKSRPAKLDKFRLTSPSKPLLEKVAQLYGGEVKPWQPGNGDPAEYEVFTNVDRLPVLVKGYRNDDDGASASSEWFEHWEGRRMKRRCDGTTERMSGGSCVCDPNGTVGWWGKRLCKPTTRLNVMLRDVPAIGNWLVISHGRNAAEKLPEMARFLARADGYIPAALGIEEQISYPDDKAPNRFMVPILEVDLTPLELFAGNAVVGAVGQRQQAAVANGSQLAIESGRQTTDWIALVAQAATVAAVRALWRSAGEAGELTPGLKGLMTARSAELASATTGNASAEDEPVDAEIVGENDDPEELDRVYAAVVENAPDWDMKRLNAEFASRNGGVMLKSGTVAELQAFLQWLKDGAR